MDIEKYKKWKKEKKKPRFRASCPFCDWEKEGHETYIRKLQGDRKPKVHKKLRRHLLEEHRDKLLTKFQNWIKAKTMDCMKCGETLYKLVKGFKCTNCGKNHSKWWAGIISFIYESEVTLEIKVTFNQETEKGKEMTEKFGEKAKMRYQEDATCQECGEKGSYILKKDSNQLSICEDCIYNLEWLSYNHLRGVYLI